MGYVPNTWEERQQMLREIGLCDMDGLYSDVPQQIRLERALNLQQAMSETQLRNHMKEIAAKNKVYRDIYLGAGAYRHYIPAVVDSICSRGEFVTAYTPYQAEMSQGILQSIFEYQTMICELTGMDVSNASVYDGASAAAEACLMVRERKKNKVLVSKAAHPQVIETMCTYAVPAGMELVLIETKEGRTDMEELAAKIDDTVAGVFIASPNYFGLLEEVEIAAQHAHSVRAKLIMGTNPIASALLKTPAAQGADIAVGDGQPLGIPLSFGGPYLGFMACKKEQMRRLPGRIVGQTEDAQGRRAFVLTLQAREQHIRREKAGSNICSNQAWCALRSAVYMAAMGKAGVRDVAKHCYANAHYLKDGLESLGFAAVYHREFFHEFVTECPVSQQKLRQGLEEHSILGGLPLEGGRLLWCATELTGKREIDRLLQVLEEVVAHG